MNRRGFLLAGSGVAGALVLGWAITPPEERLQLDATSLPLAQGEVGLNGWLKIAADGMVTIAVPRSEMGQGVYTALPMLLAEELGADWAQVRVEQSPVDQMYANLALLVDALPFEPDDHSTLREDAAWLVTKVARKISPMLTGGSSSVKDAWLTMRLAGAQAREMLVAAAAQRFGKPAGECVVANGWVTHASGLKAGFGELAQAAARITPTRMPRLKDPRDYILIGHAVPRTDVPAKVTGAAQYGLDVRLPGMLYASIRMAPVIGGDWRNWRSGMAETMPGVKAVMPVVNRLAGAPRGIAVVAEHWWQAESALVALEPQITWEESANAGMDSASLRAELQRALEQGEGHAFRKSGHLAEGFAQAVKVIEAQYSAPHLAHATMEPQNCTALVHEGQGREGRIEVWAGTQSPTLARWIAAQAADVAESQVTVHTPYLGGGFGRRIEIDLVAQAVEIARRFPGRPVQLIWPREQDTQHDVYRPASLSAFRAGIDGAGRIVAWEHRIACGSIVDSLCARAGLVFMGGGSLPQRLTHWLGTSGSPDKSNAEGAADLPYEFGSQHVAGTTVHQPVPLGFWRSVGHSQNAYFTETFLDEVAAAAGRDPCQMRRDLLQQHPRHLAVLDLAAGKAGWGTPLPAGMARGIALHESFGSIVAEVAEVSIVLEDGKRKPRVHRVVCAIDCGVAVNPGIIAQQMESAIVFGLSAALYGEITFTRGKVDQGNFDSYQVLRMHETPQVETYIVPSVAHPAGVGEPGTPPIAPAVCNALRVLTGKPVRSLPIRLD